MLKSTLIAKINNKPFYSPRDLKFAGLITNNRGNTDSYNFILKEIKRGNLKAKNMNEGGFKPVYRVYAQSIIDYLEKIGTNI